MVEHMIKLTLLFRPATRDEFVADLQKLGMVHIEQRNVEENPETARLAQRLSRVVSHRTFLAGRLAALPVPPDASPYQGKIESLVQKIDLLRVRIEGYMTERGQLDRELTSAERWGDFDPTRVEALRDHGLQMTVHSAPDGVAAEIAKELAGDPERSYVELFEDGGRIYFAVVGPATQEPPALPAPEEKLPERALSMVRERISQVDRGIDEAYAEIDALLPYRAAIDERITQLQNELSYKVVVASVQDASEGHLLFLSGWLPAAQRPALEEFLDAKEAAYLFDEPKTEDRVPIKLHNDGYTKLFEPILKIFSLPNYRELDPTPFFAPFYTIFFGLCVADLGYGLLLLAAAVAALFVLKRKSVRPLLYLGMILATSVAVCGFLLNDMFGLQITKVWGPHSSLAKAVLFSNINSAMLLAITFGIVQVCFGWVLRAVNGVRAHGAAGALRPIGVVLMVLGIAIAALTGLGPSFSVGPIPFGALIALIPDAKLVGYVMIALGLVFVLLFNSLEKKIFMRPALGLWELYELATTVPGYILSYLRLFALGLSGALLGETVINLAVMVRGDTWYGYIPMIIVILIGSTINLAIGLLSGFVHSLRLTFVEFYNSVGFKGGGVEYRPFELKS